MLFQRFYDTRLAQASYLVGCQRTGDALVVDPNRDVEQYIDFASRQGMRVTAVTETHIHADFVSGARELAARTGARLMLSDCGDADWKYTYAADAGAHLLRDGDVVMIGNIRIDVMHTPGHTPEHLSFLVTDTPAAAGAWGVLTGDFVFVGDVGRPDLLERAAGHEGTMEAGARVLYHSLQRFRELPDHLQLWPGHGAGSACGKALGAVPSSTVGYEKIGNWGLAAIGEAEFVRTVLDGQPDPPRYFAQMKRINKAGPAILGPMQPPKPLERSTFEDALAGGMRMVDTRPAAEYAKAHVPGTINIPYNGSFTGWAGWLLPYDQDIALIATAQTAAAASRDLAMIGLDRVHGFFAIDTLDHWAATGHGLGTVAQRTPEEVSAMMARGGVRLLDVRARSEWSAGHPTGAANIPLGRLIDVPLEVITDHPGDLRDDETLVVHCQSGARSAIAASVLQARGLKDVVNMTGGFVGWDGAGLPVVRGDT
ncbi:MAG: MBL fold metallo-hydrolase [Gemmatimonadota bacterium]